ncbi:NO-inducible flavohemoprotein [Dictyobacter aurantiacus]|uniref:nitric oxide dioxygenase n=1 Tax=Dictyobacter aurantiacus TaxID=1936993 RepID=A0A401ZQ25_9CHLR|nr:NO-inducible flavohemoprotein [Dictyobacter aurantiacus]GCE08971.1 flavohemoprotein [Dictyobacter aurantiacus]
MIMDTQTIGIVKSLVPALQEHGSEITTRFYAKMFEAHPELLNIFNHSNQRDGLQQQALATSVYAAAANIDDLSAILPAVKHIANKHCSLGVKPEHYPIVGKYLTLAIQDVLGDAVTLERLSAWKKAYALISDAFIQLEQQIYQEEELRRGGWSGFRPFIVRSRQRVAEDIVALELEAADGQPIIEDYLAGQYVTVKIEQDGFEHLRQYSLCEAPGSQHTYRIAVKFEDTSRDMHQAGIVSSYIHEYVRNGDTLLVSVPAGVFTLDTTLTNPVALIAGGIGITPLMSMLRTVVEQHPDREVRLAYAVRDHHFHAFADDLKQLSEKAPTVSNTIFYENGTEEDVEQRRCAYIGRITAAWLEQHIPGNAEVYVCGPRPFMQAMISTLLRQGHPMEHIHYEVFGPALSFSVD